MSGTPDARPNTPTAPIGPFFGRSPSPHGGPSPSSSAAPHPHPPAANAHLGLGTARSRPIRPRIAANNARDTATSASGNVTAFAWDTTFAPCHAETTDSSGKSGMRLTDVPNAVQNFRMFNPLLITKNLTIFQGTALAVA